MVKRKSHLFILFIGFSWGLYLGGIVMQNHFNLLAKLISGILIIFFTIFYKKEGLI